MFAITSSRSLLFFCLATVLYASLAEPAFARRRSRNGAAAAKARRETTIKAAQSQYAAAERVLAAAQSTGSGAEARLQAVLSEMTTAATGLRSARSASQELAKDLAEIEEDIIAEQSGSSPYSQLAEEIRTTKERMIRAEKRLLESANFVRKMEQLRATEGAAAAFQLRQSTLANDSEYSLLKAQLKTLSDKQGAIKRELFRKDNEWQATQAQLADSHKEEREAAIVLYGSAKERAEPKQQIKSAQQAVAAARASMAEAQQVLTRLGASVTSASGNSKSKK